MNGISMVDSQIAKYMGPIWVKCGPIWAEIWVPSGQPIWFTYGAHGPHLAQMGPVFFLHRTHHMGTIWAKWIWYGLYLGHVTSFPHCSHITHLGPTSCPDHDTIWAPDGLCGNNMGLMLHVPYGTRVLFAPYAPYGHHMGQVGTIWD